MRLIRVAGYVIRVSQGEHCSCAHRTRTYHARPCWWRTSQKRCFVSCSHGTASRSHVAPWDGRTLLLRASAFTSFHSSAEQNEELSDLWIMTLVFYLSTYLILPYLITSDPSLSYVKSYQVMLYLMVVFYCFLILWCVLLHLIPMILHVPIFM